MRDCIRFAPMIGARPGELRPDEARALEAHLSACPSCRAFSADAAATEGLVARALAERAAARDFAPFVDEVMSRVSAASGGRGASSAAAGPARASGILGFIGRHRRAAAATLAPVLAALAVIVYVRVHGGDETTEVAAVEISAEGEVTTILETADGPIVLLAQENGS